MSSNEPFELYDSDDADPTPGNVELLRAALEERCRAVKFPIEDVAATEYDKSACKIGFPCGREKRWVYCSRSRDYQLLLSIPFEQYNFITGLEAVCVYTTGEIEASIRSLTGYSGTMGLVSKIFGVPGHEFRAGKEITPIQLDSPTGDQSTTILLGRISSKLKLLLTLSSSLGAPSFSLKITGADLKQHDQAHAVLQRVANAVFFQIDLLTGVPMEVARDRRSNSRRRIMKRLDQPLSLAFPTHEYDKAPVSLYWYARSAQGMPLLEFLAYYQVIEYYLPTYSQAEARRKLKTVLKDPTFRVDRDVDLGRLLSAVQVTRSGGFGDERAQLRTTIAECVDQEDLKQFIMADSERMDFLSKGRGQSKHKLPITTANADIRNDVADRIYDIRCKIVHTKSEARTGEPDYLLPFSKEAEQLDFDIELIQYIAQQVLISASTVFR